MGTLGLFSFLGHAPVVATVMMVFFISPYTSFFRACALFFTPILKAKRVPKMKMQVGKG